MEKDETKKKKVKSKATKAEMISDWEEMTGKIHQSKIDAFMEVSISEKDDSEKCRPIIKQLQKYIEWLTEDRHKIYIECMACHKLLDKNNICYDCGNVNEPCDCPFG